MEKQSPILMGFPVPLPTARRKRGKRKREEGPPVVASIARRRVALKDASRRFAVGLRPSLTATRRLALGKAGQDGGIISSVEHRDGRKDAYPFPCAFQDYSRYLRAV
jgi:hypothetical protein